MSDTDLVERLRRDTRECPFDEPGFRMDPLEPCKVCGDVGAGPNVDLPPKCVAGRLDLLHSEAAEAIASRDAIIEGLRAELAEARERLEDFEGQLPENSEFHTIRAQYCTLRTQRRGCYK